jgi:hypothetical protein
MKHRRDECSCSQLTSQLNAARWSHHDLGHVERPAMCHRRHQSGSCQLVRLRVRTCATPLRGQVASSVVHHKKFHGANISPPCENAIFLEEHNSSFACSSLISRLLTFAERREDISCPSARWRHPRPWTKCTPAPTMYPH